MPRLVSRETIQKIKRLRHRGWSLPEIKRETGVGQGTVFRYIQGVEISPKHKKFWMGKRGGSIKRKRLAQQKAKVQAKQTITYLSEKEKLIFLSALYWGEGTKAEFGLSNTDPELIHVFVKGLQNVLGIKKERLAASIRIYEDLDRQKCLQFWSKITGIPVNSFVNVNVLKGKKKGKLPYGMCRIRVKKGGDVLKYIQALKTRTVELYLKSPHSLTDRTGVS